MTTHNMKKAILIIVISVVVLVLTWAILASLEYKSYVDKGQTMIDRVEVYKKSNGVIPDSKNQFDPYNSEMSEGPYYQKLNSEEYIVYLNIGFDDQLVYNSITKKWKKKP